MNPALSTFTFWYLLLAVGPLLATMAGFFLPSSSILGMGLGIWLAAGTFVTHEARAATPDEARRFARLVLVIVTLIWATALILLAAFGANAFAAVAWAGWMLGGMFKSLTALLAVGASFVVWYVVAYFVARIVFEWRTGKLAPAQPPAVAPDTDRQPGA